MKLNKIIILCIYLLSSHYHGFSQHKLKLRVFVTPKTCISNLSGVSLGYNTFIGGNDNYDNKNSFANTIDYMIIGKYDLTKSVSINLGIGTSKVKQRFKIAWEAFGANYKAISFTKRFEKVPISIEKKIKENSKTNIFINLGFDFIFDVFSDKYKQTTGNLKLINATTTEKITYAEYGYFNHYLTSKTFNPILSIGGGYLHKINSKFSFVSSFELKQGFSPQINSFVYFRQHYSDPTKNAYDHILSCNNGQSINLNIGLEYKF